MSMIVAHQLTRDFGNGAGVFDVSFNVDPGEIFVFLGPNGAGKSSTVKLLTGQLRPDQGTAAVAGYDSIRHRLRLKRSIGYMAERPFLDEKLTGREFVSFVADVYGVPLPARQERIKELFTAFELDTHADQLIESYSHGMRQKVALAAVLVHEPAALFLDEPTNGLDPRSARVVKDVLRQISSHGATVFMTTHVLEIAESMCDRVAIMTSGRLSAVGSVEQLRDLTGLPNGSLEDVYLALTGSVQFSELSLYGV